MVEPEVSLRVPIAAIADIAAMKVDLMAALAAFEARFASVRPDVLHRIKALTHFEDAEREPELLLLRPVDWADVKAFFEREVTAWWKR